MAVITLGPDPRYAMLDQIGYALGKSYGERANQKQDAENLSKVYQIAQDVYNQQINPTPSIEVYENVGRQSGLLPGNGLDTIRKMKQNYGDAQSQIDNKNSLLAQEEDPARQAQIRNDIAALQSQQNQAHTTADRARGLLGARGVDLAGYGANDLLGMGTVDRSISLLPQTAADYGTNVRLNQEPVAQSRQSIGSPLLPPGTVQQSDPRYMITNNDLAANPYVNSVASAKAKQDSRQAFDPATWGMRVRAAITKAGITDPRILQQAQPYIDQTASRIGARNLQEALAKTADPNERSNILGNFVANDPKYMPSYIASLLNPKAPTHIPAGSMIQNKDGTWTQVGKQQTKQSHVQLANGNIGAFASDGTIKDTGVPFYQKPVTGRTGVSGRSTSGGNSDFSKSDATHFHNYERSGQADADMGLYNEYLERVESGDELTPAEQGKYNAATKRLNPYLAYIGQASGSANTSGQQPTQAQSSEQQYAQRLSDAIANGIITKEEAWAAAVQDGYNPAQWFE